MKINIFGKKKYYILFAVLSIEDLVCIHKTSFMGPISWSVYALSMRDIAVTALV
jgi:hypothetical protein